MREAELGDILCNGKEGALKSDELSRSRKAKAFIVCLFSLCKEN